MSEDNVPIEGLGSDSGNSSLRKLMILASPYSVVGFAALSHEPLLQVRPDLHEHEDGERHTDDKTQAAE